jgi:hypothetical protein
MDHRRLPRLCEPPPRLSHGSAQGNLIPLHPPRNSPTSGRWRRAALIALGIAVLAATALLASGCAPEPVVEPVPDLSRDLDHLESRLLAGREREAWWTAWKREPASLGRRP